MKFVTVYYNIFTQSFLNTITKAGLIDATQKDFDQSDLSFRTHLDLPKLLDEFEDIEEYRDEEPYNETEAITRQFPSCLILYSRLIGKRYMDPDLMYNSLDESLTCYTMRVDLLLAIRTVTLKELSNPIDTTLSVSEQLNQFREKQERIASQTDELLKAYEWLRTHWKRSEY